MVNPMLAGVDEVGRGPLAGPVVAAAVILPEDFPRGILRDSKKLSAQQREFLSQKIWAEAMAIGIGRVEPEEIDKINILQASLKAMAMAIRDLKLQPQHIKIDGLYIPKGDFQAQQIEAIVRGDSSVPEISAASIVAKVLRDQEMKAMDVRYPGYGFAQHNGYPTALHLEALKRLGPCVIHRKTFGPVRVSAF